MAKMNISLPDQMKAFVEAQTQDGRYSNVSDYMRNLIRKDQERRQAIASGPSMPFDMKAFLAERERE
jgi:antitoxin ParD1/3/4